MEGRGIASPPAERLLVEFLRADWEGRRAQALRVLKDVERLVPASLVVNYNLVLQSLRVNRRGPPSTRTTGAVSASGPSGTASARSAIISFQEALHLLGEYDRELQQAELAQQYAPGDLQFLEAEARALVALGRVADVAARDRPEPRDHRRRPRPAAHARRKS